MPSLRPDRRTLPILAAAFALVALAGGLGARIGAPGDERGSAPQRLDRDVPRPLPIVVGALPTPVCWSCDWNEYRPLEFAVDLDHLAPLGRGGANAAAWLADFAEPSGARRSEIEGRSVELEIAGLTWKVLRGDDPLLLEAEPWVDQARCRFYPDVWKVAGGETPIPNLHVVLTLARSWIARGKLADDPNQAAEDYRRAIRLGRLLRQDDATLIQDLVAIACVRMGTEALYEAARSQGEAATLTVTAIVLADHGAMRNATAQRMTTLKGIYSALRRGADGAPVLQASDTLVDAALDLVRRAPERRFVLEGLFAVRLVRQLGTAEQRSKAGALLDELGSRGDALVAGRSREAIREGIGRDELDEMIRALSR